MQKREAAGFVVLIIVSVICGYFIYGQAGRDDSSGTAVPDVRRTATPQDGQRDMAGSDRDEHGCIGSAGYTWCEAKKKCLRTWEEECSAPAAETAAATIAGWKVYENKKLGYSLEYPGDWRATDEGKTDPAYPWDIELEKTAADPEKGYDYYMGIQSTPYGKNAAGVVYSKELALKDYAEDKSYEKIAIAGGGVGYYRMEETLGGQTFHAYLIGEKGVVSLDCNTYDASKDRTYKKIIGTFKFE